MLLDSSLQVSSWTAAHHPDHRRSDVILSSIRAQELSAAHTAGPLWALLPPKLRVRILLTETTGVVAEEGQGRDDLAARRVLITCKRLFAMEHAVSNARQIRLFTRAACPRPLQTDVSEIHEDEGSDVLSEMHGRGSGAHVHTHVGMRGHVHDHAERRGHVHLLAAVEPQAPDPKPQTPNPKP